jgi:hypothetical protein
LGGRGGGGERERGEDNKASKINKKKLIHSEVIVQNNFEIKKHCSKPGKKKKWNTPSNSKN